MVPELTITADGAHWHPVGADVRRQPRFPASPAASRRSPTPSGSSSSASSPCARPTARCPTRFGARYDGCGESTSPSEAHSPHPLVSIVIPTLEEAGELPTAARPPRRAARALGGDRRRRRLGRRHDADRPRAPVRAARRATSAADAPPSSTRARAAPPATCCSSCTPTAACRRDAYASLADAWRRPARRRRELHAALRGRAQRPVRTHARRRLPRSSAATASTTATPRSGSGARRSTRSAASGRSRSWTTTTSSGAWRAAGRRAACRGRPRHRRVAGAPSASPAPCSRGSRSAGCTWPASRRRRLVRLYRIVR